jgi:hypothetical protein
VHVVLRPQQALHRIQVVLFVVNNEDGFHFIEFLMRSDFMIWHSLSYLQGGAMDAKTTIETVLNETESFLPQKTLPNKPILVTSPTTKSFGSNLNATRCNTGKAWPKSTCGGKPPGNKLLN